jgi:hypothetical protein
MPDAHKHEIERGQMVADWAKYTAQRLQKSAKKHGVKDTGDLIYSILYDVIGAAGDTTGTKHTFNFYGKFSDMGVGRGQKIESVKGNGAIIALASGKKRTPKKWFSKTYYAEVAELRNLLLVKYGEDGANIIKESIQTII